MAAFFYGEDRPSPKYEAWERERAAEENRREIAEYLEWWRGQRMRDDTRA